MKKVNWGQLLSTVEADRKVVGTQGRKKKEQVKERFNELDAFKFVSLGWSLFWSAQATNWSNLESMSDYHVKTVKDRWDPIRGHTESMFLKQRKKEDLGIADRSTKFATMKYVQMHSSSKASGHE